MINSSFKSRAGYNGAFKYGSCTSMPAVGADQLQYKFCYKALGHTIHMEKSLMVFL